MGVLYKTNKEIPQDMLLGNLAFISLADMRISDMDLLTVFIKNNIPDSYIRSISKADAFRRASSSIKTRVITIDNTPVRVEIDEICCDSEKIKRIIGIKKIDSVKEDISYEPIGEILFNRNGNTCVACPTIDPGRQNDHVTVSNLCAEVEDKYAEWSVYHNKDTIRNTINRIITDTHPINLMPTGLCKFIPVGKTDLLYSLKDALVDMGQYVLNSSKENIMEIIPVVDTMEQRDLVRKNFRMEISDELLGLVTELKEILNAKQKISSRSAASYLEKYKFYQDKINEYESLLNIYADSLHAQMKEVLDLINDDPTI